MPPCIRTDMTLSAAAMPGPPLRRVAGLGRDSPLESMSMMRPRRTVVPPAGMTRSFHSPGDPIFELRQSCRKAAPRLEGRPSSERVKHEAGSARLRRPVARNEESRGTVVRDEGANGQIPLQRRARRHEPTA